MKILYEDEVLADFEPRVICSVCNWSDYAGEALLNISATITESRCPNCGVLFAVRTEDYPRGS